jgi:hypothetical protein
MENKSPYQVIFHTSEEIKDSEVPSIEGSASFDKEPSEGELSLLMTEYKSTFCEVYLDINNNEEYDELLFTLNA